jgi:hypothetical protein
LLINLIQKKHRQSKQGTKSSRNKHWKKRKQIHFQIWFEEGKLNLESLLLPHLQKYERGKYKSKTRGMITMLKEKTTTLKGSREVLAIGGTRLVSKRSRSGVKEAKEKC